MASIPDIGTNPERPKDKRRISQRLLREENQAFGFLGDSGFKFSDSLSRLMHHVESEENARVNIPLGAHPGFCLPVMKE